MKPIALILLSSCGFCADHVDPGFSIALKDIPDYGRYYVVTPRMYLGYPEVVGIGIDAVAGMPIGEPDDSGMGRVAGVHIDGITSINGNEGSLGLGFRNLETYSIACDYVVYRPYFENGIHRSTYRGIGADVNWFFVGGKAAIVRNNESETIVVAGLHIGF